MEVQFEKGTITFNGKNKIPHSKFDRRVNKYRAEALYYSEIAEFLKNSNFPFEDNVLDLIPCPYLTSTIKLRSYQKDALTKWFQKKTHMVPEEKRKFRNRSKIHC